MQELSQSTRHNARLARDFCQAHGDIDNNSEEVVLDLGAVYSYAVLSITMPITENVDYIRS